MYFPYIQSRQLAYRPVNAQSPYIYVPIADFSKVGATVIWDKTIDDCHNGLLSNQIMKKHNRNLWPCCVYIQIVHAWGSSINIHTIDEVISKGYKSSDM